MLTGPPDPIFAEPRLAALYDAFDGPRTDLDAYVWMVAELGARSVLDVGCGTGSLACLLAARGTEVTGLDPAAASLAVARRKPCADRVRWVEGDVDALPELAVDLAVMTGNVAQVFLTDEAWDAVLRKAFTAVRPGGRLVLESRRPEREGWRDWTPELTRAEVTTPEEGVVESWVEVTDVTGDTVTFCWTFVFSRDQAVLTSVSTLRFRGERELTDSLVRAGFVVDDVREAPDRPGLELVLVARRPDRT